MIQDGDGLYRPPKIAPASMKSSKEERNVSRKEKQVFREALQSEYARELINDLEGRPEEVSLLLLLLSLGFYWFYYITKK